MRAPISSHPHQLLLSFAFLNKPIHIQSINLQQGCQNKWWGSISICERIKLDPYTISQNEIKLALKCKYKSWNCKIPRRNHKEKFHDTGQGNNILDMTLKAEQQK